MLVGRHIVAKLLNIVLEGDYVTLSEIMLKSLFVEGQILDIVKVIVCLSTSNPRVNVAEYCLLKSICL